MQFVQDCGFARGVQPKHHDLQVMLQSCQGHETTLELLK